MAEKMVGIPDFDQATAEGYRTKSLVDAREATHSLIDQVNSRAEWLMARINMYRSGDQIVKFTPASMHYRLHPMEPFPDEWREEQRLSWQTFGVDSYGQMYALHAVAEGATLAHALDKLSVDDDGIVQAVKAMYRSTTGEDERAAVNRCNGRERKTSCTVFILAVAGSEANHRHRDPAHARSALPRTFSRRCSRPSCVMGLPGA